MSQSSSIPLLPRSLTSLETWGFGFSGLLLWLGTAPAMHAALGPGVLWVWLPGTIIGVLLNLQVKRLGTYMPEVSGGTPNYTTHLLRQFPNLARYGAIGYFLGWVSVPAMNAIILTDLIKANLDTVGLPCPVLLLQIGLVALPYIVAFSGTRTLGILHSFFVFPAVGFLISFCVHGLGWLTFAPTSPSFLPDFVGIAPLEWMKYFFIAVYAVYGCETASAFVADSRQPSLTLRCLSVTARFIPLVYLGGSWVMMRLADNPGLGDSSYLNLLAAAQPFWRGLAPAFVTFLMMSGCLLSSATAVSLCPRVLYQLARDEYLPPVFAQFSPQGVLKTGLIFTLILSLLCLMWGDVSHVVMVTGTGYLSAMMSIHFGLWVCRNRPEALLPRWSLGFLAIEAIVLGLGGWAWGWRDWVIGLLLPGIVGLAAMSLPRLAGVQGQVQQWGQKLQEYRQRILPGGTRRKPYVLTDWLIFQVTVLLVLVCSAVSIGWGLRALLDREGTGTHSALFVILLMLVAFVSVAIACWTSLPQIAAITAAREQGDRTLRDLQKTQMQLVQAEKMSSLGQLVAGVAHEINNPVNFIYGNLSYVQEYTDGLLHLIDLYQQHYPNPDAEISETAADLDLEFVQEDLGKILNSMQMGTERIRQIVLSLRNFSRMDEAEFKAVDIHEGIDSTLLILQHRLKASPHHPEIKIVRDYNPLPQVKCYAGQLNQVLMNILANAIDALEAQPQPQITLRTSQVDSDWIEIAIADNGPGIPAAIQKNIFDPFFTTKPVGKGTGMGMSISYQIIVERHGGSLKCFSTPGEGAEFVIQIPIQQA